MPRQKPAELELRLLGPIEIWVGGERVALPRSKKTRGLLAYLAATGRAHRRERLCSLLWDVTDDPKGALRWSLSRLRHVFDGAAERVEADREQVSFNTQGMKIDAAELSAALRGNLTEVPMERLQQLAQLRRGEFLEGLELTDFLDFHAWCIAERERFRSEHVQLLSELIRRLADAPSQALPYARQLAQIDAFKVDAQVLLLRLLMREDKLDEARQRFETARRLYREMGASGVAELEGAWSSLVAANRQRAPQATAPQATAPQATVLGVMQPAVDERAPDSVRAPASVRMDEARSPAHWPFTGRRKELAKLEPLLKFANKQTAPSLALISGEPGGGKSRLAERFGDRAKSAGFEVLRGRAYEAESSRPYGPWGDALGVEISSLLSDAGSSDSMETREALFQALAQRVLDIAKQHAGVVLMLDDLQWLDRDSAELLHYVIRTHAAAVREKPVGPGGALIVLLLARGGELTDNEAVLRTLRSIRRETPVVELELQPLSAEEVAQLVGSDPKIDARRVFEASAGNPLYAIELARAQSAGAEHTPSSLLQLVRERIEQLPEHAADVLRWGAVLGHAMDLERLEQLSSLELDELVDALECLEHHALLRIDATRSSQRYVFSHDVVREAVYSELSHPRRRLMHRKIARLLEPQTSDVAIATVVAYHAGRAGEAMLGVRACVVAATQSLRVFANADAEALAKQGLHLAQELEPADRIPVTLELLHIQFSARTPNREQAAAHVRSLAEQALDLGLTHAARLGFQMLSYLRWESSSMTAAHENIMQAERVSRAAAPEERTVALAQAAKCLVLLERNLAQAEAFVLEAVALSDRAGETTSAVEFANGMIAAHRGEHDAAVQRFSESRQLAREQGERLAEFCAVQHWAMLEIDRGQREAALALAESAAELGGRVRAGAEGPAGRALLELVFVMGDGEGNLQEHESRLNAAIDELRVVDAKYELSFLLTRWALHELDSDQFPRAQYLAQAALAVAQVIRRTSEQALAHVVLARCAQRDAGDPSEHLQALRELSQADLSQVARERVNALLTAP